MGSAEKRSRNLKHSTAQACIYKPHFHRVGPSFAVFLFFLRLRLIGLLRPRAVSASKRAPRRASSRDGSPRPGSRFVWHSCCSARCRALAHGRRMLRCRGCNGGRLPWPRGAAIARRARRRRGPGRPRGAPTTDGAETQLAVALVASNGNRSSTRSPPRGATAARRACSRSLQGTLRYRGGSRWGSHSRWWSPCSHARG